MTALPNHDPMRKPLDEYGDIIASIGKGLILNRPNIQAAEDTRAILLGNASAEQLARHEAKVAKEDALIAAMEKYVVRMIGDQLGFDSADAIEVEIVGQLFVGWLADDRQRCFGGLTHNGRRWEATGTVVAEGDGYVKLTFIVEMRGW